MILDKARSVDLRNQSLGSDKSQTLHGNGHGESVATILEPVAIHLTQDPTIMQGVTPCITQGNPKTGQATIGVAIPIADKATRNKGGGSTRNDDGAGNGLGIGELGTPAYTLTASDRHAVAYPCYTIDDMKMQNTYIWEEQANTLSARDYKGPQAVAIPYQSVVGPICARDYKGVGNEYVMENKLIVETKTADMESKAETYQKVTEQGAFNDMFVTNMEYIVRRLTPLECGRLQGFPDNWTQGLEIAEPTEDDILYWRMVFREQAEALEEKKKEKTDNQIRKWLQNPKSDSAIYKMWGNGIALPNAMFVMEGIAQVLQEENSHEE